MLEKKSEPTPGPSRAEAVAKKQHRRLLLTLAILLIAFASVILKERRFWFGDDVPQDGISDVNEPGVEHHAGSQSDSNTSNQATLAVTAPKRGVSAKASQETNVPDSGVVATNRTPLPPIDVEVVTGDTHRRIHPGSNATKVEIANSAPAAPESTANVSATTNAVEREPIPTGTVQANEGSVEASYLVLAPQTKVQGSVVLQALIGVDGVIQNIHVLSGPAVLTTAAEQAVRQCRFKPYLQNGQAVETKAKITVNFMIKVADNSPKSS